jgi:hypothetical protein
VEYVISRPHRKRKIDRVGNAVKVAEMMFWQNVYPFHSALPYGFADDVLFPPAL